MAHRCSFWGHSPSWGLVSGSRSILKIKTFHIQIPISSFSSNLGQAGHPASICMCVPVCHGFCFPWMCPFQEHLPPGRSPGLSLERLQGGSEGLVCRHVLYGRRGRTGKKLVPGPQLLQAAPVSVIREAERTEDPTQGSSCMAGHWLPKTVTKDGSWNNGFSYLFDFAFQKCLNYSSKVIKTMTFSGSVAKCIYSYSFLNEQIGGSCLA